MVSDLRIVREQIVGEADHHAARNTFSGVFTAGLVLSPAGPPQPTGQRVEWEVINIFRYDDQGRLAEE